MKFKNLKYQLLSSFAVVGLFLFSCGSITTNCPIAPNSIISWWDGSSVSGMNAMDRAYGSNANNGILSANVGFNSGIHTHGSAFSLDGAATSISIPNSTSLSPTQGLSISAWVKSNLDSRTSNSFQAILSNWGLQDSNGFSNPNSWQGVNIGTGGFLGSNYTYFLGGNFDGRYVYFIPYFYGVWSGYVARYDSQGGFNSASSWSGVNIGSGGILGANYQGFTGSVFDGRYLYFVAHNNGSPAGYIARLDTQGGFTSPSSWTGVNVGSGGFLGANFQGFAGGTFDGRYIYFNDYNNVGYIVRYDTQGVFNNPASWTGVNISSAAVLGTTCTPANSQSSIFDGRYVYFIPWGGGCTSRYDTLGVFNPATGPGGWSGVNISSASILGPNYTFFTGASFDGRYIYYIPNGNGAADGYVARFDTQGVFSPSSGAGGWDGVNIGTGGVLGANYIAFAGASFDGRYLYLAPQNASGSIARYDTQGVFNPSTGLGGWSGINISTASILGPNYFGYRGSTFDGRYVYFVPNFNGSPSGYVARYDTTATKASFNLMYSSYNSDGISGSLPGPTFRVNTVTGPISVQAPASLSAGSWHHVAATYDGTTLMSLYIDGQLVAAQPASGAINVSTSNVSIGALSSGGGYFNGLIDDVQIYSQALSAAQIQALYQSNLLWCH